MAEKNLIQHIDKISYGTAAVVGVVLLILPLVSGGGISETRMDLHQASDDLKRKKDEQPLRFPPLPARDLRNEIEDQWKPGSNGKSPTWIPYAAPVLLKKARSIEKRPATHAPGVITEISAHRDADKKQVYLTIKGVMGPENQYVVIEKGQLFRRVGAEGDFTAVGREFAGDFEYQDYRVKAGETYTYKFTTTASRDPNAPSNIEEPDVVDQESGEVTTPAIPYDFSIKIWQTFAAQQVNERPSLMADFSYWDYGKDTLVEKVRGRYKERAVIGKRYQISQIDLAKRSILLKDSFRKTRHTIASRDDPYPVELWEPVSFVAEEESSEEEEEAEEEVEKPEKPAEAESAPAPSGAPTTRRPRF